MNIDYQSSINHVVNVLYKWLNVVQSQQHPSIHGHSINALFLHRLSPNFSHFVAFAAPLHPSIRLDIATLCHWWFLQVDRYVCLREVISKMVMGDASDLMGYD